ncbi:hypothetical protein SYNTR_1117 [Candidatus Syntrophocurvum alkaliphilum]|uniref:NGG1p interacting factor NIF3 n=1 Tax=Candidatus Syntrophocurvum alkaliphilum TaxID=2293317 RepID=A0A6I6DH75_9FIRM|nr:NGG1p interacting factor NIF3 [Candidatus Syntrophocurvum alkaliphilum]QGT99710.1 hypothetical protein SYNTR_1117 [Candidatus Syntrophocurvum alkaliphilum]
MKLKEIYELAISMGKRSDIRGNYVNELLEKKAQEYEKLSEDEKEFFDTDNLDNPYNDTRILVGKGDEEIKTILCGIDIETPEILLADRLREKGEKIDLVLAHHPEGLARAELHGVMNMQADMLEQMGIPINIAEGIMASRVAEVERGLMPLNHQRSVDAARLLDIPFMCTHTVTDNLVNKYLQDLFDDAECVTVDDVLKKLYEIPEYHRARKLKAGPKVLVGDKKRRAGKVFVKMTGGTSGSEKSYEKLAAAGIGTIISMHMQDKHRKLAKEHNINVIIAGHIASDSLGMNLFLDELELQGIKIIPCSGLIRKKRNGELDFH